ncbi:MAG: FtsB family cell division protein, partial [Stellaceae bacterium]
MLAEIRRRARRVAGPVAAVSLVAYFSYHLVEGDRGLMAWRQSSEQIRIAEAELAQITAQEASLRHRVSLLEPNHLDRDLLDERARAVLNLAGKDERVIFFRTPQ